MLEMLLSKLPYILTFWTSILLCWGVYLNVLMHKAIKIAPDSESLKVRKYNFYCTVLANVILVVYLAFEPQLAKTAGDAIIVINVFYTAFLSFVSIVVATWFDKHTP